MWAATTVAILAALGASGAPATAAMSSPALSCGASSGCWAEVLVCAGETGAPAGFTMQWMTVDDWIANGETWPNPGAPSLCLATFAGRGGSPYRLPANGCVTVRLGEGLVEEGGIRTTCPDVPLTCGTDYLFRSRARGNRFEAGSPFSASRLCGTTACGDDGCTRPQGYWKNNPGDWPFLDTTLGAVAYTPGNWLSIFQQSVAGNGLVSLAHQLMAAKLNVAAGADPSSIAGTIAAADDMIGALVVPPIGSGYLHPSVTATLNAALSAYNTGLTGPGSCE